MSTLAALGVLAVAAAAWWVDVRYLRPWRRCPRCGGSGKGLASTPQRWGYCRRCGGEKMVRRFGAPRQ